MATEINATRAQARSGYRRFGPFKSSGGNFYVIAEDTGGRGIAAHKASSPTSSWSVADAGPEFDATFSATNYSDSEQDGDTIHTVTSAAAVDDHEILYCRFDMSSDAFQDVDGAGVDEYTIVSSFNNSGDYEANPYVQINVRSDGDVLVAYNGTRTASKGSDYSRVYYARLESSTWTVDVAVGAGTNQNERLFGMTTDSNDLSTIVYYQNDELFKRLTSGNSLDSSPTTSGLTGGAGEQAIPMQTGTAGEALLFVSSAAGQTAEMLEYTSSAETRTLDTFTSSIDYPGAAWDSTNSVAAIIFYEASSADRVYGTYDPSTNAFSEEANLMGGLAYASKTLDVSTQVGTACFSVALSSDGTKAYALDPTNAVVYQYTLSTAWDISSGSYASKSADLSSEVTSAARSLRFRSDGTSFYVLDYTTSDVVYQYNLSTPWDVSTASYASKSLDVSTETSGAISFTISSDGTKAYVIDSLEDVYQYTLSTAWDISSGSYASKSYSLPTVTTGNGIQLSPDGRYFFFCNTEGGDFIYKYILSTAYDISTASEAGKSVDISGQVNLAADFCFSADGTKVYVAAGVDETIDQFSTSGFSVVGDHANVTYSLLVDGTTLRYLYTDSANDIWYEEYSLSTGATITSAALDNVAQDFAASVDVKANISAVGLTNVAQDFAASVTALETREVSAALDNVAQDFAADATAPATLSSALTNVAQDFAADASVVASVSAALANAAQDFAASASVAASVSSTLTNAEQDFAAAVSRVSTITEAALDNVAQDFAAAANVTVSVTASLTNAAQDFAADASVAATIGQADITNAAQDFAASVAPVATVSAALDNVAQDFAANVTGQAVATITEAAFDNVAQDFAASVVHHAFVSSALNNAAQDFAANASAAVSGSAAISNAAQDFAADVTPTAAASSALANAAQDFAADATAPATLSSALANAAQDFAADTAAQIAINASLVNAAQDFAADADVAVQLSAAITNADQDFAATVGQISSVSAALTNAAQDFAASAGVTASASAAITNAAQDFAADASVVATVSSSITNAAQDLAASASVIATISAAIANAAQDFAAALGGVTSVSAALANAAQDLASDASVGVAASAALNNADQDFAASIGALETRQASAALSNPAQGFSCSTSVVVTTSGALANESQVIAANGDVIASLTVPLENVAQAISTDTSVLIQLTGAITNADQDFAAQAQQNIVYLFGSDLELALFGADLELALFGADLELALFGSDITFDAP